MPVQQTLVSVEEYLNTSYDGPDREYVDGRIVERNLGEKSHHLARHAVDCRKPLVLLIMRPKHVS